MSTSEFYHELEACPDFSAAIRGECFAPVPGDWIVIATDVVDSTVAVEAGRYKDVTVAGAISTISIANVTGGLDFPFFFGGDGMVFLLPPQFREQVLAVLADVRQMVAYISGLTLRAGVAEVGRLMAMGARLSIGKVQVTERYTQAVAAGELLDLMDRLLKADDPVVERPPAEPPEDGPRANVRGFSCRWQDIPSRHGETLSLIVEQAGTTRTGRSGLQAAHDAINEIARPDETHPLSVEAQFTTSRREVAGAEASYRARGTEGLRYLLLRLRIWLEVRVVRLALATGLPIRGEGKLLRGVRQDNIRNADVYKIDGTLKMILSVTRAQREALVARLEELRAEGAIRYGWHVSDRAIMTCLIHTNYSDEVHFVDAADGGYAIAARMLKAQRAAS